VDKQTWGRSELGVGRMLGQTLQFKWGVHMKRVVLLSCFLILFWTCTGVASAESATGLNGPLKDVVDTVKDVVDEAKKPAEKALPPVTTPLKKPVEDVTKEIGKVVDTVLKGVTDVAKSPPEPSAGGGDKPSPVPPIGSPGSSPSELERSTTGAAETKSEAARTSRGSSRATRGANRARPAGDTEQVAAAGNTIEPAEVKGTKIVAPATDVEESQGSGLSITGAQILTWLILACGLVGAGAAFVLSGRLRARTVSS